jgi:hypothetical protein
MVAKRKRLAGVAVTALVMALAVVVARRRGDSPPAGTSGKPDECVAAAVAAAERGDVAAYLDCFTGELRGQLAAESAASRPAGRFADSLRASVAGMKASVVSGLEEMGGGEAELRWERVYARYNEVYRVRLRRVGGGRWKIAALERIARSTPEIPYGTPVFPAAPEPETKPRPPGE